MQLHDVVAVTVTTERSAEEVRCEILKTRDATMLAVAVFLAVAVAAVSSSPVLAQYTPCSPGYGGSCYPSYNNPSYGNPYSSPYYPNYGNSYNSPYYPSYGNNYSPYYPNYGNPYSSPYYPNYGNHYYSPYHPYYGYHYYNPYNPYYGNYYSPYHHQHH